jgi:hypothetical protein
MPPTGSYFFVRVNADALESIFGPPLGAPAQGSWLIGGFVVEESSIGTWLDIKRMARPDGTEVPLGHEQRVVLIRWELIRTARLFPGLLEVPDFTMGMYL